MASTAVYANWDTISGQFQRFQEAPTSPIFGYYVQNIFEMRNEAGAFAQRERGLFGTHYVNTTGGDLDTTWIAADYAAVESAVQTMWTALAARITTDYRLVEHRWYAFGPGVVKPNPPVRVTTLGTPILGTSSALNWHQNAITCTFRTALRRHWGRIYFPATAFTLANGGQLTSSSTDEVAGAFRTMVTAPSTSQGVAPVIWDRNRKVALGISALEVDSVPDIIRRRRPRVAAYKKLYTA
jgi:hypothetical protein